MRSRLKAMWKNLIFDSQSEKKHAMLEKTMLDYVYTSQTNENRRVVEWEIAFCDTPMEVLEILGFEVFFRMPICM